MVMVYTDSALSTSLYSLNTFSVMSGKQTLLTPLYDDIYNKHVYIDIDVEYVLKGKKGHRVLRVHTRLREGRKKWRKQS